MLESLPGVEAEPCLPDRGRRPDLQGRHTGPVSGFRRATKLVAFSLCDMKERRGMRINHWNVRRHRTPRGARRTTPCPRDRHIDQARRDRGPVPLVPAGAALARRRGMPALRGVDTPALARVPVEVALLRVPVSVQRHGRHPVPQLSPSGLEVVRRRPPDARVAGGNLRERAAAGDRRQLQDRLVRRTGSALRCAAGEPILRSLVEAEPPDDDESRRLRRRSPSPAEHEVPRTPTSTSAAGARRIATTRTCSATRSSPCSRVKGSRMSSWSRPGSARAVRPRSSSCRAHVLPRAQLVRLRIPDRAGAWPGSPVTSRRTASTCCASRCSTASPAG